MPTGPALDNLATAITVACRSGLDPDALRAAVLPRLRQVVPIDALWWAAVDPATLLFTRAYREGLPADSGPYFVDNEFLHDDVNKWTDLARDRVGVRTLMQSTEDRPGLSDRYRDIFAPLGLQDELRAVLRVRGSSWGYLCLHRETARTNFSEDEARFVRRIAPHLAEGLRMGLIRQACDADSPAEGPGAGPGLVLLAVDGTVVGMNQAAGGWLEDLGGQPDGTDLPVEIRALAIRLAHPNESEPSGARLRVRTRTGRWAVLHASWMTAAVEQTVAVILEEAAPAEIAPVLMVAYGLTVREQTVSGLVCQGLSTRHISERLHLTIDTVQDHLKSIYVRTGVHSRGELVALIFQRDYLPRIVAGDRLTPAGSFAATKQPR